MKGTIALVLAALATTACTPSDDTSPSTSAPTTSVAASTTAAETTTTPAPATTSPATTTAAPTTTQATPDGDVIAIAENAQNVLKECYKVLPEPCDQAALDGAFVGVELQVMNDRVAEYAGEGRYTKDVDDKVYTQLTDPVSFEGDLTVIPYCVFDPVKAYNADGSAYNDEVVYYREDWHLLPVGDTYKVSEIVWGGSFHQTQEAACGT